MITKSSCMARRKGWVNLKSAKCSWKDRFKWAQKQYVGTGGKFSFKIFIWHRISFHKLQVYFLLETLTFLHFFHFLKTFAVKIESNFEGFMLVLFLRKKILFFPTASLCSAGSGGTARAAEQASEGGNRQDPREVAIFHQRFLVGICLEADGRIKH